MLSQFKEAVLSRIIGLVVHRRERLTPKEDAAESSFARSLDMPRRKTKKAIVIALIGLVGSGKSAVAKALAQHLGATVVEGDAIRVELRKQGERYEGARVIAENVASRIVTHGGNVILDSDFVDEKKRASLREKVRKGKDIQLVFIRTHCDLDVMVGRALTAGYRDTVDDFFGGAPSSWKGSEQSKGAVVKVREMRRRTPHHYRWVNRVGGMWILRKFPFAIFAEIDTTDESQWKREVENIAARLARL